MGIPAKIQSRNCNTFPLGIFEAVLTVFYKSRDNPGIRGRTTLPFIKTI